MPKHPPFQTPAVAAKFAAYPVGARRKLMALRQCIFETAAKLPGVSEIEETLKWSEPAYLTRAVGKTRSTGSTIRIDWKPRAPDQYAMYFNCQTNLIDTFRTLFPTDFEFEGNRALVFDLDRAPPQTALAFCIAAALTYHQKK
jgi:hypothetical protein